MKDQLWGGLGETVEKPEHANVALLLIEPLVVQRVTTVHGLNTVE